MHNRRLRSRIELFEVAIATLGVLLIAASLTIMPVFADTNDATADLVLSCEVQPLLTPTSSIQSGVQGLVPGEQVQFVLSVPYSEGTIYQDILTRPDGSTYYASYLELISLPSNLVLDPASIDFRIAPGSSADPVADGVSQTLVAGPTSDPSSFALVTDTAVAGQTTWRVLFPGDEAQMLADQDGDGDPSYTVPAGGEIFAMTFTAQLPVGATWGAVEDGSECFATTSTGPSNRDTDRVRTAVAAVIPELEISKTTPASNAYVAGGIARYEFTATVPLVDKATGSLTVAPARDVSLVDDVPNGLIAIDGGGNPVADGGTTSGGGVWDETARTVTYTLGDMNPGDTISIDEEMQIATGVLPATLLTNDLKGIISYMPGSDPDDTIVDPADTDDATVTVASSDPTVSKEAEFESYGVGLPFDYTVVIDIPGDSEYYNFTILDTLPDGMQFLNYISATCTPAGATCPDPITTLAPTVFPSGGGTGIGWYPNALPADVNPRQIELVYEVQLDPAYFNEDEVLFFDSFTNDLEVQWNTVDRLGVIPPATASPPSFDGGISTSDDIIYDRPILQIDKTVATSDGVFADEAREGWDFEEGDLATYTSIITNVGSRDAVDLTIVDVPVGIDIDPASVTVAGAACVAPDCTWDGTTLTVSYAGPVAPAGDFTIEYTASPTQTGDLDNQINIPTYADTLGTAYTESPGDTVPLSIPDPVLTIDKDPSDGVVETGVANSLGTKFPFTFTVTNTGAVTAYNPIVTDVPPANVCVIAGGLNAAAAGAVTETAPGVFALDAPLAPGASVTFDADVEVCGPIEAGTYENTANLTWEDLSDATDSTGAAYSDTDPAPLVLEAPQYEVTKGPAVDAGATINWTFDSDDSGTIDPDEYNQGAWTIIIENTSTVPIGGLVVDDPMPDPFEYNPGDATVVWIGQTPDTFTDKSTASGTTVLSGYTEQLDFEIGQLQAGAEIRITVPFSHNGLDPSDGDLTRLNTVQVTNDNITFDPSLHEADGEYSLIPIEEGPTLAKTVDEVGIYPGVETIEGAPGKQVDFSIDLTIPTSTTLDTFDVWVLDELPDGLTLANEPVANAVPSAGGWTVSCISGPCGTVSEGGAYLGSQPGQNGKTELAWFIGDVPPDGSATPIVMRLTFRAEVEANFDDGSEVIDGLNDPLVNQAFPIFNRSNVVPGGSGNVVAGLPATFPSSNDYDRVYPKDPAEIDLVTPRLDIEKTAYNADGDPVQEINAGDEFSYEVKYTNVGSGPAFDIDFSDDLANPEGIPFATIDQSSLVLTVDAVPLTAAADGDGLTCLFVPFGPNGGVNLECEFDGPLVGDVDGPSGAALGGQIVIAYDGTTVDNDDFFAQFSTQNFDPMFIRNTAMATEYFESAGEGGNQYATGFASTRLFAFTPKPEIDMWCVGGADIIPGAPAGSDVQFQVVVGNGDKVDVSGNADGDTTLTPFPQVDTDGDGYPDAGFGFNPVFTLTIQDSYVFNGVQGTGPGWGDATYTNYTPFPAPDQILDEVQPNTYTLVWDSLPGIPHSPENDEEEDFLAWYDLLIDVTKTGTGGASFWFDLSFTDADGNTDRGSNVSEYFELVEKDRHGCPGGPPPRVWKTPDADDGVSVLPGQATEFVMYIQQPDEDPMSGDFIDNLPDGLIYAGDLLVTDPLYAVATMDVVPPTWTDDNDGDGDVDLEDYFTSSTAQPNGDTTLLWEPPPLPQGLTSDPNNGDADTRWIIRVPVVSEDPVPYPFELVVNGFTWDTADFGPRSDTGVVTTDGGGRPDIEKRVSNKEGPYGSLFTYTIDVTFPSGYAGTDVIIYDQINRVNNWEGAPYSNQQLGNMNSNTAIFPVVPPVTYPNTAGELSYAHYGYTPAEFTLDNYVSDFCVVGCSGAADAIDAVPMTPQPVAETLTNPLSSADPYYTNANGAIGWYLGDIEPDPEGQDRVVRLTYTVEAPTITEQRQRVIEHGPTPFPGGTSDPLFDDVDGYWMWELSQVNHPNLVQLRSWGGGNPELAVWEGGTDTDWQTTNNTQWGNLSGSSLLDSDDTYVTVAYPLLTMDKDCGAINDPNGTNPVPTPIGSANITCELTIENKSPVDAFDVSVTDTPLTDCVIGGRSYYGRFRYSTNIANGDLRDPIVDGAGTGRIDPLDPDVVRYSCDISGEFVNDPELTSVPNTFPASWSTSLGASQIKTFTYQMRVDGWTDQPAISQNNTNGTWEISGAWTNDAVLQPWADEPGGVALGEEIRVRDEVFFHDPFINISKFPYPADRDLSVDASPFPDYLNDDDECDINNLWPFIYKNDCGRSYNPASTNQTAVQDYGDPFAGDYWMRDQPDAYNDLLQPPSRAITPYSWPQHMRGIALGFHWYAFNGWTDFGDVFDVSTGNRGYVDRPLNEDSAWADAFDVEPTQPYTWAIDIRIDGMERLESIDIEDQLPYGWDFVPGSAKIVDGNWFLGYTNNGWAENNGVTPGYGLVTLPDPVIDNTTEGTCSTAAWHEAGPTMSFEFERDTAGEDQPWEYRYLDARDRYGTHTTYSDYAAGESDKMNWIRIHYDAVPDPSILACDPDTSSSDTWFMENNVSLSALRDYDAGVMTDTYRMLAPVPNPVALEKLPDDDYVSDETVNDFTITFTNDLDVPVEDITFTDELTSAPVAPLPDGGYDCGTVTVVGGTGFTESCVGGLGSQTTSLEWFFSSIAPGETIVITMPIIVPKDETNLLVWDNTVSTTVKEYYDAPLADGGKNTVVNASPPPTPSKSSTPNPATVNDVVDYEVSFTANRYQVFFDLAYIDTIPDGLTFESFEGISCSGSCPAGFTDADVLEFTPVVNGDGTTTLWWFFGDLPGSGTGNHTWTMSYRARVDDSYNDGSTVLDEDVLTNVAQGFSNEENLLDTPVGIPSPADWTTYPPSALVEHDLDIEEPELAIAKSATPSSDPLDSSGTVIFQVEVTNDGGTAAYAVEVSDTPNGALENIVMDPTTFAGSVVTVGWTATDPTVGWFIPVIQPGETAIFTYVAEVADGFLEEGYPAAENDAEVETYRARPGVDPEPGDRFYGGEEVSVAVDLAGPQLEMQKYVGGCTDDFAFTAPGVSTIWCLEVENTGGAPAYGAVVSDTLPYQWLYDAGSTAGSGGWTVTEPTIGAPFTGVQEVSWAIGDLLPGDVMQITFTATAGEDAPLNVTNWAVVNSFQSDGSPLPPTVTGASDDDPASAAMGDHALEIAKTPDRQQWGLIPSGGTVTWTLSITNPAATSSNTNLVITDTLPVPLTYSTWSSTDPRVSLNGANAAAGPNGEDVVVWDISDLAAGESVDIVITATVPPATPVANQWYVNDSEVQSEEISDPVVNQAKVMFFEPASVGNFAWLDSDSDGIQDSGEPGLDGITVNLLDANGDQLYRDPATGLISTDAGFGWPAMSVVTGDDPSTPGVETGWYGFDELPPGTYRLEFVPTAAHGPTIENAGGDDAADSDVDPLTGLSHLVVLDPGENDSTIDAGFIPFDEYLENLASIDVEKDTNGFQADVEPGPVLVVGDAVTWTYEVTNTGPMALVDAQVVDSEGVAVECDSDRDGAFDNGDTIPLLRPNESVTCEGTGTATGGQYENTASIEGSPVVPDLATCGCDLGDPSTWPTDPAGYEPATGPGGEDLGPVTDDDPSHYFGAEGGIAVEKFTNGAQADTEPGPVLAVGDAVTWTYVVTNTSTTALSAVAVTDSEGVVVGCDTDGDFAFDDGNVIPVLIPGQSVSCQGTGTAAAGQYQNTASTSGTPILPDPATCGCALSDPTTWPSDPAVYTPAIDVNGDPLDDVSDTDPSHYYGAEGAIDVAKSTNGLQADIEPGPVVDTGDAVTWTYVVTNDTNAAIVDATVTDSEGVIVECDIDGDFAFDDGNVIPLLLPGDSVTCEGTGTATDGQYENTASVSGTPVLPDPTTCGCDLSDPDTWPTDPTLFADPVDENGDPLPPVTDDDPSHYFGFSGGIDVEKWTDGVQADTEPGPVLDVGDTVTWTYRVTNTSTAALTDVVVTDSEGVLVDCDIDGDFAFDDGNLIPLLVPGASVTCEGSGTVSAGQYENTAATSGTPELPDPATCGCDLSDPTTWPTDDPTVYTPALDESGDPIDDVTDTDPSHYFGDDGEIGIEKSTNGVDADVEPGPAIDTGDPVTWTYVVTNDTPLAIVDAIVTDSEGVIVNCDVDGNAVFDGGNVIPLMLPGDEVTCQGSGIAEDGQYSNTGAVSGTPVLPDPTTCGCDLSDPTTWPIDPTLFADPVDENGDPLPPMTGDDPSHYFGESGGIDVEKWTGGEQADTPTGPVIQTDGSVTWTYVVTNTSTTALTDVVVTDSQGVVVECDIDLDFAFDDGNVIQLLGPTQSTTCQGTGTATAGQYQNIASTTGTPILPDPSTCGCDLDDPTSWPNDVTLYTNAVDEFGDPLPPVVDADPSHFYGADGNIDINKSTNGVDADVEPGPAIDTDAPVTWTYVVTNASNMTVINAAVTDSQGVVVNCDSDDNGIFDEGNVIPLMLPGDEVTCEGTGLATDGQYQNDGAISGTPVLPDPATCGCDIDDPTTWPTEPTEYPEPIDPNGNPLPAVTADDSSHFFGVSGGIDVEKWTEGVQADSAPGPVLDVGDIAVWTYLVTNTSTTALIDIYVTDSRGVAVNCDIDGDTIFDDDNFIALLVPSQAIVCQGFEPVEAGQYDNVASTSGTPVLPDPGTCDCDLADPTTWPDDDPAVYLEVVDDNGDPLPAVIDADPSHYFGNEGVVDIEKSTNGVDADVAPGPGVTVGDEVTWTYVVTNDTPMALANSSVIDDQGVTVNCDNNSDLVFDEGPVILMLVPGASVTCEATGIATGGPYTNLGSVAGTPVLPDPAACGCELDDPTTWPTDDPALYTSPVDENGDPIPPVTDADPSHYFGEDPGLGIEKSTNGVDADLAPGPGIPVASAVSWTYVVTNSGFAAIVPATVTDSEGVRIDCDTDGDGTFDGTNVIALMLPGQQVACRGSGPATAGQYENQGLVSGPPQVPNPETCDCDLGDPATWPRSPFGYEPLRDPTTGEIVPNLFAQDPSHYFGIGGRLDMEKSTNGVDADELPGPEIAVGQDVIWTYVVTNNSTGPVLNATVVDDQGVVIDCGGGSNVIALLQPGNAVTCEGRGTAVAGQYVNIGDVVAEPAGPNPEICGCDPFDPSTWPEDPAAYEPLVDPETNKPVAPATAIDSSGYYGMLVDLMLEKKLIEATPTGATFEFVTTSNGPDVARGPIEIVDQLPDGLTFVSFSGNGWFCSADGQSVTCSHPDDLAATMSSPALTIVTNIVAPAGTEMVNNASTRSETLGTPANEVDPTNNGSLAQLTVPAIPPSGPLAFSGSESNRVATTAVLMILLGCVLLFLSRYKKEGDLS